jgi:hypothetical protein
VPNLSDSSLNHPRFPKHSRAGGSAARSLTLTYDTVWGIIVLLGVLAMAAKLPIYQRPLARLKAQPA